MVTKEGSVQILSFMTTGTGVLVRRRDHISHYHLIYIIFYFIDIQQIEWAIVLRDYDTAFLFNSGFLFNMWLGCWYANMIPSDKKSM